MDSDYHLVSFYLITGKIFKANMLGNCWKLIYPPFKPRYPPRGGRRNSIKTIISIILWHLKYTHTQHTRTQSLQSNSNNFFKKRRRRWYVTKGKTIFLGRIDQELMRFSSGDLMEEHLHSGGWWNYLGNQE